MYRGFILKGVIIVVAVLFTEGVGVYSAERVRQPAVSGSWYPADAEALTEMVDDYLKQANPPQVDGKIIGLVAPHAGFVYSGPVAAYSFKLVSGMSFDTVFLFGNAHRVGFIGAALDDVNAYQTPLGKVPVDTRLINELVSRVNHVAINSQAHAPDHVLEAQIPFLQRTLKPGYKIVPILFGMHPEDSLRYLVGKIPALVRNKRVLFIASTDLTHYPSYADSCRIDAKTVHAIASMKPAELDKVVTETMQQHVNRLDCVLCSPTATKAVMLLSKKFGADYGSVLRRANSGDVAVGDRSRVVGYCAVAFIASNPAGRESRTEADESDNGEYSEQRKKYLLAVSRYVLETYVKTGKIPEIAVSDPLYREKRGVFVTLNVHERLRGCIGYIEPIKPLMDAVIQNTINACSRDPRFSPVQESELGSIDIEISILTPPRKIDSYRRIVLGRDGVILKKSFHQAVFLPQVAPEQGWNLEQTLTHLALKAGLSPDAWKQGAQFEVFQAVVFSEKELGRQSFEK